MTPAELPTIVVADPIPAAAIERLRAGPCRVVDATGGPDPLEASLPEAWGLIVRSRTKVTRALLDRAPRLAFVARAGVGVDNIDLAAATARGIRVVNAPAAASASVAELAVALLLMLSRNLYPKVLETKGGGWKRSDLGSELSGKTVGFVGYGRIGREVARRLAPFGVRTIAYDPYVAAPGLCSLDELLAQADFVSLHAAATPETHHLIDGGRLAKMKRSAYLVNLARGSLVDERALLDALVSGRIAGAALDVFETEPPTFRELLDHPKVIATPHLGASTHEGQTRAGLEVVEDALRALEGKPLQGLVRSTGAP